MFSLADVSNEVLLRVEQEDSSGPRIKKSGMHDIGRAFFDVISMALADGEEVTIPQFGKFFPYPKPARTARNPKTGEKIKVKAKVIPKFRPSSALREKVLKAKVKKKK